MFICSFLFEATNTWLYYPRWPPSKQTKTARSWTVCLLFYWRSIPPTSSKFLCTYIISSMHLAMFSYPPADQVVCRTISNDKASFEFTVSQHFRMSGVYWGLTALSLLGKNLSEEIDVDAISSWIMECQHENGGWVICLRDDKLDDIHACTGVIICYLTFLLILSLFRLILPLSSLPLSLSLSLSLSTSLSLSLSLSLSTSLRVSLYVSLSTSLSLRLSLYVSLSMSLSISLLVMDMHCTVTVQVWWVCGSRYACVVHSERAADPGSAGPPGPCGGQGPSGGVRCRHAADWRVICGGPVGWVVNACMPIYVCYVCIDIKYIVHIIFITTELWMSLYYILK
jgi:hypothetical protein